MKEVKHLISNFMYLVLLAYYFFKNDMILEVHL